MEQVKNENKSKEGYAKYSRFCLKSYEDNQCNISSEDAKKIMFMFIYRIDEGNMHRKKSKLYLK